LDFIFGDTDNFFVTYVCFCVFHMYFGENTGRT
jgi:hypothetical protein